MDTDLTPIQPLEPVSQPAPVSVSSEPTDNPVAASTLVEPPINKEPSTERLVVRPEQKVTGPIPEKYLAPIAVGLGVLLIVGGIILLGFSGRKKVASLPIFSPIFISPEPASPDPSHEVASPVPAATPSTNKSTTQIASIKGATTTQAKKSVRSKSAQPAPAAPVSNTISLPDYQAKSSSLADYQPSFISPVAQSSPVQSTTQSQSQTQSPLPETVMVTIKVPAHQYALAVVKGSTVLSAMESARKLGLTFETKDFSGLGRLVTSINGVSQTDSTFWKYSLNGVFAKQGISSQTLSDDTTVLWELSAS